MIVNKDELQSLYFINSDIYFLAKHFNCEHKTIRAYLIEYNITQQNFIAHTSNYLKSYQEPTWQELIQKNSIIAHSFYLCEG